MQFHRLDSGRLDDELLAALVNFHTASAVKGNMTIRKSGSSICVALLLCTQALISSACGESFTAMDLKSTNDGFSEFDCGTGLNEQADCSSPILPTPTATPLPAATPNPLPPPTTPIQMPAPLPDPTPTPAATATPAPTPTPLCRSTVHTIFTLNSASTYKPYFMDRAITAPLGTVNAVAGNGWTAFFSCVDFGGPNGVSYIIRTMAEPYVPSMAPGACSESLHMALIRNGSQTSAFRSYFDDIVYSVAMDKTVAVTGRSGWVMAMKCTSDGFVFRAFTQD